MQPTRFDTFTRTLATDGSRRAVLRVLTGGVVGLAALAGRRAQAQLPTPACAEFCQQLPPGPERAACISQAAQGQGPCSDCLPAGASLGVCNGATVVRCCNRSCSLSTHVCG